MLPQASRRTTPSFTPALSAVLAALGGEGIDRFDQSGYPPLNIYRTGDNDYTIEMAVAGFSPDDIEITLEGRVLTVATALQGDQKDDANSDKVFLHRGIARRDFRRSYTLAEHMVVRDAQIANGLLSISLSREIPEEAKPRRISIQAA